MVTTIDAPLTGDGLRFAIVVARFNEHVTRRLLDGALAAFRSRGVADSALTVVWVPGAFEIPGAARRAIDCLGVDAVVALGAVIRGDTAHFEYVCRAATDGVLQAGLAAAKPVIFGVLTVDTLEQALARAADGAGNKGFEAALGALEMANVYRALEACKESGS
jgi:6,7-dimethyl-8-ribityllumazine synthase